MKSTNRRISLHHIGGRNGSRAFPLLRKFEKDMINVLYDADADCLGQVREKNVYLDSELHVLPYCLADTCKAASVNINYDPFTSSLYDANPEYDSYYYFYKDYDYLVSEATAVMEKRRVEAVSMDYIFQATDINMPPPDFLSIDTQGSEYDILLGAKETLKSNVVALVIEAEFHPLYKGQRLFGDLAKLLSEQGFYFVRFLGIGEMSPFRSPLGLRGQGFHMFADALFLRQIDNIAHGEDELGRYLMLRKLAFISIVFEQFEYGLECLRRSKEFIAHPSTIQGEEPVYLRFLKDIEQQAERIPAVYPVTFTSKYKSFSASKSRFEIAADNVKRANKDGTIYKTKQLLKRIPMVLTIYKTKQSLKQTPMVFLLLLKQIFVPYTGVEAVLIKYGLKTQANTLRKNRVVQSQVKKS